MNLRAILKHGKRLDEQKEQKKHQSRMNRTYY